MHDPHPTSHADRRTSVRAGGCADAAVDPYGGVLPELITRSAQLDGCDGSYTCSANLNVREGTFVVTGIVHGVRRAAEPRGLALVEEPPKATAIMALKMVERHASNRRRN